MQVEIQKNPDFSNFDHLYVLLPEGSAPGSLQLATNIVELIEPVMASARFSGRADESISLLHEDMKITLAGLGKRNKLSRRSVRIAIRALGKTMQRHRDRRVAVAVPRLFNDLDLRRELRLLADMLANADYRYATFLSEEERAKIVDIRAVLVAPDSATDEDVTRAEEEARSVAAAVARVRDFGNMPPNELTPTRFAELASELCGELKIKCTVLDLAGIRKEGMGGLLAVNQGSVQEPRFVVMEYEPSGTATKTVVVVGKGITFDTGGISIKPSERMEEMKFDMSGAAAVVGIVEAASNLRLPVKLVGIFAATENVPSGSAYKPSDIIRMMSGKTVEIVNTDAEGRMILGDALHYAERFKPDHLIDFATLTGACVVALGGEASGLFTNDDALARKLIESGQRVGERLWQLPEWDEYKEAIKSEWADMKNSGGRWAGAITAAVFLKQFVSSPSWAHIDIAGTAYAESENSRDARGATGAGVRMMVDFLESLT